MEMKTIVVVETDDPSNGSRPLDRELAKEHSSEMETAQSNAEVPGHTTRFSYCPTEGEQS